MLKSSGAEKLNNAHVIKKASILDQAQHQKPGLKSGGAASPPTLLLNLVEITFCSSFVVACPRLQFSPIKRFLRERGLGTSWEKLSLRCPRARSEMLVLNIGEFADSWVMTPRAGEATGAPEISHMENKISYFDQVIYRLNNSRRVTGLLLSFLSRSRWTKWPPETLFLLFPKLL